MRISSDNVIRETGFEGLDSFGGSDPEFLHDHWRINGVPSISATSSSVSLIVRASIFS